MKHSPTSWMPLAIALACAATTARGAEPTDAQMRAMSAQWWQWATSIPAPVNALSDRTLPEGNSPNCAVGQRGATWFIGGAVTPGAVRRRCTLPPGTSLFFPVINAINVNTPWHCGQGAPKTVAQLRADVAPFMDAATTSVTLDGQRVDRVRRVRSDPFVVVLPVQNILLAPCQGDSPAGMYWPAVDDGHYVMLAPLKPGSHVLAFRGVTGDFALDVTYELLVEPVMQPSGL